MSLQERDKIVTDYVRAKCRDRTSNFECVQRVLAKLQGVGERSLADPRGHRPPFLPR